MVQHTGPLTSSSKICLYLENGGYVAATSLTGVDLHVERSAQPVTPTSTVSSTLSSTIVAASPSDPPARFERCVFSIYAVDRWQPSSQGPSNTVGRSKTVVRYGDTVELCHAYTQRWMCVLAKVQSHTEKSSLRLTLLNSKDVEDSSNDHVFRFKILPKFKVRTEGENVRINDEVILVPDTDDSRCLHASAVPNGDGNRELNCAFMSNCVANSSSWTMMLYDDCAKDPQAIRLGVPISLFHAETEAFLTSDDCVARQESKGLKQYTSPAPLMTLEPSRVIVNTRREGQDRMLKQSKALPKSKSFSSKPSFHGNKLRTRADVQLDAFRDFVQELQAVYPMDAPTDVVYLSPPVDQTGGDHSKSPTSNAIWVIENLEPNVGGPVEFSKPYRLKHVVTGQYLGINRLEGRGRKYEWKMSFQREEGDPNHGDQTKRTPSDIFVFLPIDQQTQPCVHPAQSFFVIQHVKSQLFMHFMPHASRDSPTPVGSARNRPVIRIGLSRQLLYEDVFSCNIDLNAKQLMDLNEVVHSVDMMKLYIDAFRRPRCRYSDSKVQHSIGVCRDAIGQLVAMCSVSDEPNPLNRSGPPIPQNQQLLFDQSVHHVVMDVVKCPFEAPAKGLPDFKPCIKYAECQEVKYKKIQYIVKLAYRLLTMMIRGSNRFSMQLYPYLPFMQTQLSHGFDITGTMIQIFRNNEALLYRMNDDVLQVIIRLLDAQYGHRDGYLRLLSELCCCSGDGIAQTQNFICENLLLSSGPTSRLRGFLDMRLMMGQVEVYTAAPPMPPDVAVIAESLQKGSTAVESLVNTIRRAAGEISSARDRGLNKVMQGVQLRNIWAPRQETTDHTSFGRELTDGIDTFLRREDMYDHWVHISELCASGGKDIVDTMDVVLGVLPRICMNQNSFTTPIVSDWVGPEMIVAVLGPGSDVLNLPDRIRCKFYDILTHAYIDTQRTAQSFCIRLIHKTLKVWSRLGADHQESDASAEAVHPCFADLKEASLQTLRCNTSLRALTPARTCLVHSILGMWKHIIRYRMYDRLEVKSLVECVVQILCTEGRHKEDRRKSVAPALFDEPVAAVSTPVTSHGLMFDDSYSAYEADIVVLQCMEACLNIMNELLDQHIDQTVMHILQQFRHVVQALAACAAVEGNENFDAASHMEMFANEVAEPIMASLEPSGVRPHSKDSPFSFLQATFQQKNFPQVLLGLTMFEYEPLVNMALLLVLKMSSLQNQASALLVEQCLLYSESSEQTWLEAARDANDLLVALTEDKHDRSTECVCQFVKLIAPPPDAFADEWEGDKEGEVNDDSSSSGESTIQSEPSTLTDLSSGRTLKDLSPRKGTVNRKGSESSTKGVNRKGSNSSTKGVKRTGSNSSTKGAAHTSGGKPELPSSAGSPRVQTVTSELTDEESFDENNVSMQLTDLRSVQSLERKELEKLKEKEAAEKAAAEAALTEIENLKAEEEDEEEEEEEEVPPPPPSKWSRVRDIVRYLHRRNLSGRKDLDPYITVNKDILRHLRIHELIIQVLQQPFSNLPHEGARGTLFCSCYKFLQLFCDRRCAGPHLVTVCCLLLLPIRPPLPSYLFPARALLLPRSLRPAFPRSPIIVVEPA